MAPRTMGMPDNNSKCEGSGKLELTADEENWADVAEEGKGDTLLFSLSPPPSGSTR